MRALAVVAGSPVRRDGGVARAERSALQDLEPDLVPGDRAAEGRHRGAGPRPDPDVASAAAGRHVGHADVPGVHVDRPVHPVAQAVDALVDDRPGSGRMDPDRRRRGCQVEVADRVGVVVVLRQERQRVLTGGDGDVDTDRGDVGLVDRGAERAVAGARCHLAHTVAGAGPRPSAVVVTTRYRCRYRVAAAQQQHGEASADGRCEDRQPASNVHERPPVRRPEGVPRDHAQRREASRSIATRAQASIFATSLRSMVMLRLVLPCSPDDAVPGPSS